MSKIVVKFNKDKLRKDLEIKEPLSEEQVKKLIPKFDISQFATLVEIGKVWEKINELDDSIKKLLENWLKEINTLKGTIFVGNNSSPQRVTMLTPSGAINDTNTEFTFNKKPTFIVINGALYKLNNGWSWNESTKKATLEFAPLSGSDVYGIF